VLRFEAGSPERALGFVEHFGELGDDAGDMGGRGAELIDQGVRVVLASCPRTAAPTAKTPEHRRLPAASPKHRHAVCRATAPSSLARRVLPMPGSPESKQSPPAADCGL